MCLMGKSNLTMSWVGFWDCFKLITQDLGEELKGGMKVDREGTNVGKKGLGDNKWITMCHQALVSMLAWPVPVPEHHSLSHILIKLHPQLSAVCVSPLFSVCNPLASFKPV